MAWLNVVTDRATERVVTHGWEGKEARGDMAGLGMVQSSDGLCK